MLFFFLTAKSNTKKLASLPVHSEAYFLPANLQR